MLLFFAPSVQQFAVIGDAGIHEKCGETFWQEITRTMGTLLKEEDFTSAVVAGVREAGYLLAQHFPRASDDQNELPNAVEGD